MKIVYTVSILLVALLSATATAQDVTTVDASLVETGAEAATDANFEYDAASIGAEAEPTAVEEVGADADVATAADETTEGAEADREAADTDAVDEVGADGDVAAVDEAASADVTEADREAEPTVEEVGADAVEEVGADADEVASADVTEADREAEPTVEEVGADAVEEVGADADEVASADVTEADREAEPTVEEVGAGAVEEVGADADAEVTDVAEADREADETDAVDEIGADADADATAEDVVGADADADTVDTGDDAEVGADDDAATAAPVAEVGADADLDLTQPHSFIFPEVRQAIIMTVNKRRQEAGLPQICLNYKLMNTAQSQSNFMAKTNTITVTGDKGSSPSDRGVLARYNATAGVAEVVGAGYDKPDDLINAWMQSEDSKSIVLGNYTHIGPGYTVDEKQQYVKYWVVDFSYGVGESCSGLAA